MGYGPQTTMIDSAFIYSLCIILTKAYIYMLVKDHTNHKSQFHVHSDMLPHKDVDLHVLVYHTDEL